MAKSKGDSWTSLLYTSADGDPDTCPAVEKRGDPRVREETAHHVDEPLGQAETTDGSDDKVMVD